jgi:hypothetical protein
MGTELAVLGLYPKSDKKNKVYYVNRNIFRFPVPKLDEKGNKIPKTNPSNGNPIFNSRGEQEFHEDSLQFTHWHTRFTDLGYWSVFEVKKETPKIVAKLLEEFAASKKSEVMDEEAFIKLTNPQMLEEVKRNNELEKEIETLKAEKEAEKSKADAEIARLKEKAGIK